MGSWLRAKPDEQAGAGREHLDPDLVALYDRKSAFDPTEDVALLRELGLGGDCTLVDLGAGTGTFALAASAHCRQVVAVDASPAMVAHLRERVSAAGVANVDVVHAGLLSYEHRRAPVDFVYCRNVLHHLPDFWKAVALTGMRLLLRPGGILRLRDIVFSFEPEEAQERVEAWLASAPETQESGWTRAELERHLRDEHSTFTWLLERMLERAGFDIASTRYDRQGIFAAYVCAAT